MIKKILLFFEHVLLLPALILIYIENVQNQNIAVLLHAINVLLFAFLFSSYFFKPKKEN